MHRPLFLYIGLFLLLVVPSVAPADEPVPEPPRTLDEYVAVALSRNPSLIAAELHVRSSAERPSVVGALPDPVVGFGYYIETPETRVGPKEWSVALSQRLPFFGKRGLEGAVARHAAGADTMAYRRQRLELEYDVKRWYHEYYRLTEVSRTLADEKQLLQRMQDIAQVQYASGQVSQQDVLKAQLSLSQVDDELAMNARGLVTATTRLEELIGYRHGGLPEPVLSVPTLGDFDPDALFFRAHQSRPELASADADIARARAARDLAGKQHWPDLMVGVQYVSVGKRGIPDLPEDGKDIVQINAGINLPLWFGSNKAQVRQADADVAWAQSQRRAAELRVGTEVADATERVETARERLALYETVIVPQAEHTFASSEAGYRAGSIDFLDYLDSQRMLLSVRKQYHGVVADLGAQIAYLERVVGTRLNGNGQSHE